MLPSSLQVSIVTYRPDMALLKRTLDTLRVAIDTAQRAGVVNTVHVALVDNSVDADIALVVSACAQRAFAGASVKVRNLSGHANIGYGAGHNLVLHGTGSDFHLVLNPDAELAADALVAGVRWLDAHPDVGALAPTVSDAAGNRQYLCKRYPAVLDLLLRGFAPAFVCRRFAARLSRYEMRDIVDVDPPRDAIGVPILSGACILARRDAIDRTGGFDPRFFLYFEDFDWSVRLNAITRNAFVPSVAIVHHGGGTARKGWRHARWFIASAGRFYFKHGWRWV